MLLTAKHGLWLVACGLGKDCLSLYKQFITTYHTVHSVLYSHYSVIGRTCEELKVPKKQRIVLGVLYNLYRSSRRSNRLHEPRPRLLVGLHYYMTLFLSLPFPSPSKIPHSRFTPDT